MKCGGNPMEAEKKKQAVKQEDNDDYFNRNWRGKN